MKAILIATSGVLILLTFGSYMAGYGILGYGAGTDEYKEHTEACLTRTGLTMDDLERLKHKSVGAPLSDVEQTLICCLTEPLSVNGTLNIEHTILIGKKHAVNPDVNISSVLSSCAINGINSDDLSVCPKIASSFHCYFATLHKPTGSDAESAFSTLIKPIAQLSDSEPAKNNSKQDEQQQPTNNNNIVLQQPINQTEDEHEKLTEECLNQTNLTRDSLDVMKNKTVGDALSNVEQELICCLTKSLVLNGTLDTERTILIGKKHAVDPAVDHTSIINSCQTNEISTSDLSACSNLASLFHCYFATLHKPSAGTADNVISR